MTRSAQLFNRHTKEGESEIVLWHCFGQIGNQGDGFGLAAVVEKQNGDVIEVDADRLRFLKPWEEAA